MAPKGRSRKRLNRMYAAIDAMAPLGFDERLVRKILKQLLKEYGGDVGWAFIEEYGYKELLEAILRDQERNDDDTPRIEMGVSSQDKTAEDLSLQIINVPSGTLVACNKVGNTVGETSCSVLGTAAVAPAGEELCYNKQDFGKFEVLCLPSAEGDGNRCRDMGEDQTSTQTETADAVFSNDGTSRNLVQTGSKACVVASYPRSSSSPTVNHLKLYSGKQVKLGSNPHVPTPIPTSNPGPVNNPPPLADHHLTSHPSTKRVCLDPPRRRFPCYGWIEESDEEEDVELIHLPPMKPTNDR